jgi:multisubunit Na+/H+ antiporter MnhC subunit
MAVESFDLIGLIGFKTIILLRKDKTRLIIVLEIIHQQSLVVIYLSKGGKRQNTFTL